MSVTTVIIAACFDCIRTGHAQFYAVTSHYI